jgi:hypothetical protein
MRKRTYATCLAVLGLGVGAGVAPGASGDPVANKSLCKDGGFAQAPLTVLSFKNQGQCVDYFNHGGTVPAPPPPPPPCGGYICL